MLRNSTSISYVEAPHVSASTLHLNSRPQYNTRYLVVKEHMDVMYLLNKLKRHNRPFKCSKPVCRFNHAHGGPNCKHDNNAYAYSNRKTARDNNACSSRHFKKRDNYGGPTTSGTISLVISTVATIGTTISSVPQVFSTSVTIVIQPVTFYYISSSLL
jgi:hypothetical protein